MPLVPFYRLHRRVYAAYFDLFTPADWEKEVAASAAERASGNGSSSARPWRTSRPGEAQAERDVQPAGRGTRRVRRAHQRAARAAASQKWFSFDVPVDAAQPWPSS